MYIELRSTSEFMYFVILSHHCTTQFMLFLLFFVAPPVFLVSPVEEILVIEGKLVTLNCTAEGNPLLAITWMINNSIVSAVDSNFNITLSNDSFTQTSVLSFIATEMDSLRTNGTILYCVADNSIKSGVESNRTLVTIAGECFTILA